MDCVAKPAAFFGRAKVAYGVPYLDLASLLANATWWLGWFSGWA